MATEPLGLSRGASSLTASVGSVGGCLILVFTGHSGDVLGNLPTWTIVLALTLLALPLIAGAPPVPPESAAARPGKARWGLQMAMLLLVLDFISSLTFLHYKVIQAQIPLIPLIHEE